VLTMVRGRGGASLAGVWIEKERGRDGGRGAEV
jgi:hypothetical protein